MTDGQQPKSSVDHPQDRGGQMNCEPETSGASSTATTSYTYISLGPEFTDFFGTNRREILVREEYPTLMKYIKEVQAGNGQARLRRYGAVVTGRPGIGQEPRRLYVHFLTSLCRKNVVYPLCTHRKNP
jgi:hypothetical protein